MQKDTNKLSPDKISFLNAYRAALIWAAFILFLCLLPGDDLPDIDFWEINIEDKIAHIGVFAIFAILMARGSWLRGSLEHNWYRSSFTLIAVGIAFGILTEALQGYFMTSRYASVSDVVADAIGIIAGVVFSILYFRRIIS